MMTVLLQITVPAVQEARQNAQATFNGDIAKL
jgi:hypothetical protein